MRREAAGKVAAPVVALLLGVGMALGLGAGVTGCSRDSSGSGEPATTAAAPWASAGPVSSASTGGSASAGAPGPGASASPSGSTAATPPPASPSASSAPSASAAQPPPGSGSASTRLLDPGQPPRQKLRYTWHLDQKEQLAMDLRTSATTEVAGSKQPEIPLPPVHIVIDVDPRGITPDGELHFAWRVSATSVTADPSTPSPIADGMRTEVSGIEHLAGTAVVTARGVSTGVTVDASTLLVDAGSTGQMVEQVRQTLRDVAVPMPEEEVGRGARWQKISQLDAKGSRLTQTDTFTLSALGPGATGGVDDVLAQTAPPQLLKTPGMGNGAEARMESMLASGSSKTRYDLGHLIPQTQFTGTTTMVVSGQSNADATKRVTMVMRVGIDIQGRPR